MFFDPGDSVGRAGGRSVGGVAGWFVGVLAVCLGGGSILGSSVWLVSVACFVCWLAVDGLVGWLVGRCLRWFVRSVVRSGLGSLFFVRPLARHVVALLVRWLLSAAGLLLCRVGSLARPNACRPPSLVGACPARSRWYSCARLVAWSCVAFPSHGLLTL